MAERVAVAAQCKDYELDTESTKASSRKRGFAAFPDKGRNLLSLLHSTSVHADDNASIGYVYVDRFFFRNINSSLDTRFDIVCKRLHKTFDSPVSNKSDREPGAQHPPWQLWQFVIVTQGP